ncbi:hypothetical protein RRG08_031187 [Elysia crispata]|uniref:Uncharacterized protein n=1 Tax=Elysia crispata TaxID=231223 RepID=A0AAE0ZFC8_9GAST|nr:hypothetical protein RRG08_031187 [Elysia crispata]
MEGSTERRDQQNVGINRTSKGSGSEGDAQTVPVRSRRRAVINRCFLLKLHLPALGDKPESCTALSRSTMEPNTIWSQDLEVRHGAQHNMESGSRGPPWSPTQYGVRI